MTMSGLNHLRLVASGTRLRPGVELELELTRRSAYRLNELVRPPMQYLLHMRRVPYFWQEA